jgi:hypothetical protein
MSTEYYDELTRLEPKHKTRKLSPLAKAWTTATIGWAIAIASTTTLITRETSPDRQVVLLQLDSSRQTAQREMLTQQLTTAQTNAERWRDSTTTLLRQLDVRYITSTLSCSLAVANARAAAASKQDDRTRR